MHQAAIVHTREEQGESREKPVLHLVPIGLALWLQDTLCNQPRSRLTIPPSSTLLLHLNGEHKPQERLLPSTQLGPAHPKAT